MSIYKEASKQKLRVGTSAGNLSVEQLWEVPVTELDFLAVGLQEEYKSSGNKSFLQIDSKKDKKLKLKFDIVLDILKTKVENQEKAHKAAETKAHNQKILELIAQKKEGQLTEKSIEELEGMLK